MTEGQETNGKNQAERRPVPLWERHGMSQQDYCDAAAISQHGMRKLGFAELKVQESRDLLGLLMDAGIDNGDLSGRAIYVLDRVQLLLKSAVKKIDKYGVEQRYRDVENWKQRGAS